MVKDIQDNAGKSPANLSEKDIVTFLEHLAVNRNVSPSTQNQAFALVFLYEHVIGKTLDRFDNFVRAKSPDT